ncbi:hypothetical protein [Flammeovirga sp. EKP202]|uniref:hypothetical protein n=1 Tax=Flammeovirga sp. EKP202 TaxID=2770592 RepID=UPI00165F75D5|nr:hypothetical protein [Flammeovirga sp. EKP202]MBD0403333.1 hypothetical protein [Flammeovirga sp. EKP202]
MTFFVIHESTGDEIGEIFPQAKCLEYTDNYHSQNSITRLPNLKIPSIKPDFNTVILGDKAKKTDVISSGLITSYSFIVNHKVKRLLEQFVLPLHDFYEVILKRKKGNIIDNYFVLHFQESFSKYIDFKSSIISIQTLPPWNIPNWNFNKEIVNLDSYYDFEKLSKNVAG